MAEEVKIVDVAGGPAAEATLQEILKVLKAQGGRGGGGSGGASAAAEKVQSLYTDSVKRAIPVRKKNTDAVKESTSVFQTMSSVVGGAFGLFTKSLGVATGLITNFGAATMNATSISEFMEAVPVFGSLLGKASGYFDDSLNTFRQLSQTGAGFGNDMLAMRNAAAESGLSMQQFAEVVGNNSQQMGLLGGTTSAGAARFGKLTRALRQQEAGLMRLGFTQEEVNEGFADYIEMMAASGQLRGRSDRELTAGAQSYLTEIDKLARVTGRSRKEMQEEMNQRMAAANYNVLAARLSGDALLNFQNNTQFTSDMMGQGFADVMTDLGDGVAQSGFAQKLQSAVPGLADLAEANARGEISQEEYQRRLAELAPQITSFADNLGAAGTSALMQEEGFGEFMESVSRARTLTQRMADANEAAAAQARRAPLTETFGQFGQTIQDIRSNIEDALLDSGVLDTLGTMIGGVSSTLTDVISSITTEVVDYLKSDEFKSSVETFRGYMTDAGEKIKEFIASVKSGAIREKIDNFVAAIQRGWTSISNFVGEVSEKGLFQTIQDNFGPQIESMMESLKNALIIGIGGLFAAKIVTSALSSGVSALFGGGGGGRSGGGGGAAGKAGAGAGSFVGQMAGGAMKGAATGISAFANPTVIAGAAGLAGVILVIGAAVAGATWLVGKSLPTFAEGMKEFESLDGTALVAAGKGMLAVSAGMAAFGAGSAVAGIGNAVGAIGDAVAGLFGGEDPMEKIKRFQTYDFDEAKITGNANAVVAFSKAMAAQGAGAAAGGAGAAVGVIGSAIASFFGGETGIPYDDIIKFQGYTFDTAKVQANAAAMVAFNQALTSSAGAQATSGVGNAVGAIGNAISSFFGGETPFDQVKNFGDMDINAEGVSTNAGAMVAMANALNAFSGGEASDITISAATVASLTRLSEMGATSGLGKLATDLNNVASVQGLSANITTLNSLDAEGVRSYNTAMEKLVETLEDLNKVLAEDNEGMMGGGTGVSVSSMMQDGQLFGGGGEAGTGSSEQLDRLNSLVSQLVTLTQESNRYTRGTMRAVGGNLQLGV